MGHSIGFDHVGGTYVSTYTATVRWTRSGDGAFTKGQYSRAHERACQDGRKSQPSA